MVPERTSLPATATAHAPYQDAKAFLDLAHVGDEAIHLGVETAEVDQGEVLGPGQGFAVSSISSSRMLVRSALEKASSTRLAINT